MNNFYYENWYLFYMDNNILNTLKKKNNENKKKSINQIIERINNFY